MELMNNAMDALIVIGRYNSPTDSLISPVSKGLLRRGKTRAYHYLRSSPHEPSSHGSLVPPKVPTYKSSDNGFSSKQHSISIR